MSRPATWTAVFLTVIALSLGCWRPVAAPPVPVAQNPNPPAPAPNPAPLPANARTFDLIPTIDLSKDVIHGNGWRLVNNELHCDQGSFVPRVQLPWIPPPEYDFTVTFTQRQLRNGISLVMPKPQGDGSFFWYLGSGGGSEFGFHAQGGNKGGNQAGLIQANRQYTTTVKVRNGSVEGYLNGNLLVEVRNNLGALSSDDWRKVKDARVLAVACDDPTVFHRIQITEITGQGRSAR